MGAWGMGVFDDDTSCDLLYEAMETDALSFIKKAQNHKDAEYLEYDECHEVIVAASIMDYILNGTKYNHNTDGYDEWLSKQGKEGIEDLKSDISESLRRVLSEESELNELWLENEEDYPTWKVNIESILSNLNG
jgi:hypothetical protein